jgi:hypothetical protein
MSEKSLSDNMNSTGMHDMRIRPWKEWVSLYTPPPPPTPQLLMDMSDEDRERVYHVSEVTVEVDLQETIAALKVLDEGSRDEVAMETHLSEPGAVVLDGEMLDLEIWGEDADYKALFRTTRAFVHCSLMGINPDTGKLEVTLQLILRQEEMENGEEEDVG